MSYIGYKIIDCPKCKMKFKIPIKDKKEDVRCPICERVIDKEHVIKILDKPNDDYRAYSINTEEVLFNY